MLPRTHRLSKKDNLKYTLNKGKKINTDLFITKYKKNYLTYPRFAVILSSKVTKKTTVRNKIRRQIYESIRLYLKNNKKTAPYDIGIICKREIAGMKHEEIKKEIGKILDKILGRKSDSSLSACASPDK